MRVIEYRDVRPDGTLLSHWACPEGMEYSQDYSQFGPENFPVPPWERQRREPGGDWKTVFRYIARPNGETLEAGDYVWME